MDEHLARIAELEERIRSVEETTETLADSILKLEKILDDIASYIIPEHQPDTDNDS